LTALRHLAKMTPSRAKPDAASFVMKQVGRNGTPPRDFARRFASIRRGLAALAFITLSGCGWHLQGSTRLPATVSVTYIDTEDRYSDFNRALRDGLSSAGVTLASDARSATAIVKIIKETTGQRVLSVSARNTPEEYEVFYQVEYSVSNQASELIAPQKIELTRDYSFDERAVLAKQREQSVLQEALARDLAAQVVRRMATL
jgi:LPS-assembly lipoprotein